MHRYHFSPTGTIPVSEQSAPLLNRVRDTITAHAMLTPEDRVLVAVSGGPDSVALLHILRELGYDVVVAHLDHMTRDGESAEDAAFVEALACETGVPVIIERRPVEAQAAAGPESFEQAARAARYDFFESAAEREGCAVIATGHSADDMAETVLWRLIRGTSVDGIAGIPPVRSLNGVRVVRPLIDSTRREILRFLTEVSIRYRTDPSNSDPKFLRNRIRNELLPLLRTEFNPNVNEALVRLSGLARDDAIVVAELLDPFLGTCLTEDGGIDRARFAKGPASLQRRAVQTLAWRRGIDAPYERIEAVRAFVQTGHTGAKLDLGGAMLLNTKTHTRFLHDAAEQETVLVTVPGVGVFLDNTFSARLLDRAPQTPLSDYCSPSRQVFDADVLGSTVHVRNRKPGDRFTPLGMRGTRKLQDYFVDSAVPQDERDRVPIVEADGKIAWVVGGAVDAAFAVNETTKRLVELEVTDAPE